MLQIGKALELRMSTKKLVLETLRAFEADLERCSFCKTTMAVVAVEKWHSMRYGVRQMAPMYQLQQIFMSIPKRCDIECVG